MIKTKIVSSLDKVFPDEGLEKYASLKEASSLLGERISFQLAYTYETDEENRTFAPYTAKLIGDLAAYATMREVKCVAVTRAYGLKYDDNYLRTTPGAYPDLLYPMPENGKFCAATNLTSAIWIDVAVPENKSLAGIHSIGVRITRGDNLICEDMLTVKVVGALLPKQRLRCTQWASLGTLSNYYGIKSWSAKHFAMIEKFLQRGYENGMNMVLLPIFGGLVDVKKNGNRYSFSFAKLGKLIDVCQRIGFEFYEMEHLFSSGDAAWASTIPYTENGVKKTTKGLRATSDEYLAIVRPLISALRKYMKARGLDDKCYYHIADEPALKNIELFRAARNGVIDLLDGVKIIDAIFDFEYYKEGLVTSPVPITDHIEPFIEGGVKELWTYYCTGPQTKVSNRFISQSGACTRSIGMQLYKYRLTGFLHWALFYYGGGDTGGIVNPYVEQSGKSWVPAGDTFLIYPAGNGEPHDSLRLLIFGDAMQDIRAMELCESLYSHDEVVKAIENILGTELKFTTCAKTSETMLKIRETINDMIARKL